MDYLDFGSSDSDEEGNISNFNPGGGGALDSDEEERIDNNRILKMLSIKSAEQPKSKSAQKMLDFEAEMEAELDRRATLIENEGGLEHQKSLSRSSSSSSLHSLGGGGDNINKMTKPALLGPPPGPSCLVVASSSTTKRKKVKFAADADAENGTGQMEMESETNNDTTVEKSNDGEDNTTYDQIYFDSDESDGENDDLQRHRKAKRKLLTNDELLYDPESDAADQAWVDKQRRQYCRPAPGKKIQPKESASINQAIVGNVTDPIPPNSTDPVASGSASSTNTEIPLPSTDAVLNCPACFTVLCMDCQRHEFYSGQFRAMFVMNCKIDRNETLTVPLKSSKGKSKKDRKKGLPAEEAISNVATSESDKFFPVRCRVCNSQVAVYDSEEIYHFFNCLASHP